MIFKKNWNFLQLQTFYEFKRNQTCVFLFNISFLTEIKKKTFLLEMHTALLKMHTALLEMQTALLECTQRW